ncbi:MAG: ABC transporter ATP-binding protein, partial [Clostridiales bacterium]|nr:ABC transporter ATP-binding protein [Clostridiales bacterium]
MDIAKRLGLLLKPYRRPVTLSLLLQFVVILTRLTAPFLMVPIINIAIPNRSIAQLMPYVAGLMGLSAARSACNYFRGLMLEQVSQDVVYDMRTGLYAHLQELPYVFYDKHRIGEIMSRMTGDIDGVRNLIAGGLVQIFEAALHFVGALIFMGLMSGRLMLAMLTFAPLLAITAYLFNKKIRPAFAEIREQNATLNTRTQENLAGVRVVKAFAREPYESERFSEENLKLLGLNLTATRIWAQFVPLMELMSGMCTPTLLLVGGYMVLNGTMDLGTLVAANGYVWLIINPMRSLSGIINMAAQAITSAEKLFYYADFGSAIREPADATSPAEFRGRVEFDHVTFSYGGEDVLRDVSFTAEPGQTVAVMGATGAGKTSLTLLMGRYYDVRSGSVKVDGIDVRRQKLKPLRREIGYVMQETFLFSDTLADNVRFGRPEADLSHVERAAQAAQAMEFVDQLPRGWDTIVGERGLGLSGGQKQRTAIARAVLTDPSILVLDDATSAVDMETEYLI